MWGPLSLSHFVATESVKKNKFCQEDVSAQFLNRSIDRTLKVRRKTQIFASGRRPEVPKGNKCPRKSYPVSLPRELDIPHAVCGGLECRQSADCATQPGYPEKWGDQHWKPNEVASFNRGIFFSVSPQGIESVKVIGCLLVCRENRIKCMAHILPL